MKLSRSQYADKRRDERAQDAEDWRKTPGAVVRVQGCLCRSVWCPRCALISPTGSAIRERLSVLDWRKVRHCVLTVNRSGTAEEKFAEVRRNRAIAKAMSALGTGRWLWVLEFHIGGWPHWHVIVEAGGKMIGHHRLKAAWGRGHVWESPVTGPDHWGAILGYHKSKGYFAGETKGHQLELPGYLSGCARVRKFGASFSLSCPWPKRGKQESCHRRKAATRYSDRFDFCDSETKLVVGGRVSAVEGSLLETTEAVRGASMHEIGRGRFFVGQKELSGVLSGEGITTKGGRQDP